MLVVMMLMTASSAMAQDVKFEVIDGFRYSLDTGTKTASLIQQITKPTNHFKFCFLRHRTTCRHEHHNNKHNKALKRAAGSTFTFQEPFS